MDRTTGGRGWYRGGAARDRPGTRRRPSDAAREGREIVTRPERCSRGSRGRRGRPGRHFTQAAADGSFEITPVPPGTWVVHAWHERGQAASRGVSVPSTGASGIELQLDARGFRWTPHKNKYGQDYPTNAGRERY